MIDLERRNAGLWIWLNRPDNLNALLPDMIADIDRALTEAAGDNDLRAIVISGRGRAFCAGADIKYNQSVAGTAGGNLAFVKSVSDLTARLEDYPLPVIAALNGVTAAGGLEIALGCDMIFAADTAKIGDLHANYALFPGGGAPVRLARRIGAAAAKRLMFWGDTITASEALTVGLIDNVVPHNNLTASVDQIIAKMENKSPLVLRRMKAAINRAFDVPLRHALEWERDINELHSHSSDRAEGLAAFKDKRPPRFTGQ